MSVFVRVSLRLHPLTVHKKRSKEAKPRLDRLLLDRGLASSLEKAQGLILAGAVRINGVPSLKPGKPVGGDAIISVQEPEHPYVSRGGLKLAHALDHFQVPVADRIALDIGASTGGFTHCLLLRGARRIHAVDVGYGQLAWEIRRDPRVRVLERTNARYLTLELVGEPVDLAVIDASFISLKLIVPPLQSILSPGGEVLTLVKPQFEVGRGKVGKGGVVRDEAERLAAVESLVADFSRQGWAVSGPEPSPITGAKGNREYFLHLHRADGAGGSRMASP